MKREIVEIPQEKLDAMKYYYDPLIAGICIQKYLETEDGKGDFIPVYANKAFAESMGIPFELVYQFTLRQVSKEFPEKQLQDMVEVAFDGRVINGDSFSKDYSKYFTVRIYQYQYGYTIMFMADATSVHISSSTLQSVSRAYDSIYYARLQEPVCSRVFPAQDNNAISKSYEDIVKDIMVENNVCQEDRFILDNFFDIENIKKAVFVDDVTSQRFRASLENGSYRWYLAEVIVNERSMFEP